MNLPSSQIVDFNDSLGGSNGQERAIHARNERIAFIFSELDYLFDRSLLKGNRSCSPSQVGIRSQLLVPVLLETFSR